MARPRISGLTRAQSRILRAIARCIEKYGHAAITELVAELGLAGDTSLVPTLRIMERNGFVRIRGGGQRGRRRTIDLAVPGKAALGLAGLPVLGQIPAGPLSEA